MPKKSTKRKTKSKSAGTKRKKTVASSSSSPRKKTVSKKKTTGRKTSVKKTKTGGSGKKTSTRKKTKTQKKTVRKAAASKAPAGKKKRTKTAAEATPADTEKIAADAPKKGTRRKKSAQTAAASSQRGGRTEKTARSSAKSGSRKKAPAVQSVAEAASASKADSDGYVYINGRRVRMISSTKPAPTRKSRTPNPAAEPTDAETVEAKPIKTHLTGRELNRFRNLLLLKRAEIVGDLSAMEEAALQLGGNLSNLPIHMADIGTDTYDQDFMLGLAESERQRIREIDDALHRIEEKTYGICQMTGQPIPHARLEAKPWAKYTIEAARALEEPWRT